MLVPNTPAATVEHLHLISLWMLWCVHSLATCQQVATLQMRFGKTWDDAGTRCEAQLSSEQRVTQPFWEGSRLVQTDPRSRLSDTWSVFERHSVSVTSYIINVSSSTDGGVTSAPTHGSLTSILVSRLVPVCHFTWLHRNRCVFFWERGSQAGGVGVHGPGPRGSPQVPLGDTHQPQRKSWHFHLERRPRRASGAGQRLPTAAHYSPRPAARCAAAHAEVILPRSLWAPRFQHPFNGRDLSLLRPPFLPPFISILSAMMIPLPCCHGNNWGPWLLGC